MKPARWPVGHSARSPARCGPWGRHSPPAPEARDTRRAARAGSGRVEMARHPNPNPKPGRGAVSIGSTPGSGVTRGPGASRDTGRPAPAVLNGRAQRRLLDLRHEDDLANGRRAPRAGGSAGRPVFVVALVLPVLEPIGHLRPGSRGPAHLDVPVGDPGFDLVGKVAAFAFGARLSLDLLQSRLGTNPGPSVRADFGLGLAAEAQSSCPRRGADLDIRGACWRGLRLLTPLRPP